METCQFSRITCQLIDGIDITPLGAKANSTPSLSESITGTFNDENMYKLEAFYLRSTVPQ